MKRCITNLGATDPDYRLDRIAFMERKIGAFRYHHKISLTDSYGNKKAKQVTTKSNIGRTTWFRSYYFKDITYGNFYNFKYVADFIERNKNRNNPLLRGKPHEL